MKRNLSIILSLLMINGIAGCNYVSAANDSNIEEIVTEVKGSENMISVREVFESLGYDINWESTSKTLYASRKKRVISITVGSDIAELNGEKIKMNSMAYVENGILLITVASMKELTGEDISDKGEIITIEETSDDSWKNNKVNVDLSKVGSDTYTITETGVYTLSGDYNGMIYINCDGKVKLILNGVNITNENGPAIFFENSKKGIIEANENTENTLTDGSKYSVDAKGCIFSNDDLDIQGKGTINIIANYNHGIASDDDIEIEDGNINITTSIGDGIHANEGVNIVIGNIYVDAMGDGISGDKYVLINDGDVVINTKGEIAESTDDEIPFGGGMKEFNGDFKERGRGEIPDMSFGDKGKKSNSGEMPERAFEFMGEKPEMHMDNNKTEKFILEENTETTTEDESISSKGIKSDGHVTINGGNISINSTDHCIKSDNMIVINGGNINAASNISKGMKAMGCLFINNGDIYIDTKDEGIESKATVTINGGNINITSQDDGINAGGGSGATMMNNVQDGDEHQVVINGGSINIDARCDGIDSNGNLYFYGGEVNINGPSSGGDGALDSGAKNVIYGGTIFAISSMGMVECPETGGEQNILNINFDSVQSADSSILIMENSDTIYESISTKEFQNLIFSSDQIKADNEYSVYVNGKKLVTVTAERGITKYGSDMSRMDNKREFGRNMPSHGNPE